MFLRYNLFDPLPQEVSCPGFPSSLSEGRHVSDPVNDAGLGLCCFKEECPGPGGYQTGGVGFAVDERGVYRESVGAFPADKTGAQLVANLVPRVDHGYGVAFTCQPQGGVIARRSGSHHNYIIQVG